MKRIEHKISLRCIGESRQLLMGLATIWVVLFHSYSLNFLNSEILCNLHIGGLLQHIKNTGNAGVDLFLFCSGYGLYYSLHKDTDILHFYRRRFSRIIPSIVIVFLIYYGWKGCGSFSDYLSSFFLYGFYLKGAPDVAYWFFSLLLVLYALYPVFHRIIEQYDIFGMIFITGLSVVLAMLIRKTDIEYFYRIEIALTRISVFIIGIFVGKKSECGYEIPISIVLASIIVVGVIYAIIINIELPIWVIRYLYAPLVLSISLLAALWNRSVSDNAIRRFIKFIGLYSLEMYLIYEQLYLNLRWFYKASDKIDLTYTGACFITALILSVALKEVNRIIYDRMLRLG